MASEKPFAEYLIKSFDDFESKYLIIQKNRNFKEAVYRGQSESSWELIPSIFRDAPNTSSISFDWIEEKIEEEYQSVRYFVQHADDIGFDLPGELFQILNTKNLNGATFISSYRIPTHNFVEIITLAQHHGARTRFLYFTFNPYV